jgi:catecholate siderophore receptor
VKLWVPGAVTPNKQQVALTAYNNATDRTNLFNQTDVTSVASTGSFRHTLLAGAEIGRQATDNVRTTGYFHNTATTILVPYGAPTITTPVTYRQSATDADNNVHQRGGDLRPGSGRGFAAPAAARRRALRSLRSRVSQQPERDTLGRVDNLVCPGRGSSSSPSFRCPCAELQRLVSPELGRPVSSLTVITQQVEPEQFTNYEVGAKWDVRPALSFTTAAYRLDRTNTRATDPNDPTRIVQTGSQRTNGYELGINGAFTPAWKVAGVYAYQDAFVTSATVAARAGAIVGQVPRSTFSLWNNYQVHPRVGLGLGVFIGRHVRHHRQHRGPARLHPRGCCGLRSADARGGPAAAERRESLFDANYYERRQQHQHLVRIPPRGARRRHDGVLSVGSAFRRTSAGRLKPAATS